MRQSLDSMMHDISPLQIRSHTDKSSSPAGDPHELSRLVKSQARKIGFDLVGITVPAPSAHGDYVRQWLADGRHGQMHYLEKNIEDRLDIKRRFPWALSVICAAISYYNEPESKENGADQGQIARYAWGRDYHRVLTAKLKMLEHVLRQMAGEQFHSRIYVDTGPVMERELAVRAGLGWIGKNTLLIHPRHGSWFVLGEMITSLRMEPDSPLTDHCGTCTRCIDHCPTDALKAWQLDATRCISYHTLENRGEVPAEFHDPMREANYLAGCDICQTVCPFNRRPLASSEPHFSPPTQTCTVETEQIAEWTQESWDQFTRGRAFRRAQLHMWKRNATILLGQRV
ncbi:MAG TPA: tRNA epoxyqueuosine(34) reductase QueG [Phycisphaerae bacterium]|nr:tRNA epoxyqueuosine(34) reductase QueG [Phycisphaerae bacterium]